VISDKHWNHYKDLDEVSFTLRDKRIVIQLYKIPGRHVSANWVLEPTYAEVPEGAVGYDIIFKVDGETDVTGGGEEFAIFSAVLKVLNEYFSEREWDYLQFTGESGSRNRLYQALAQRMTRSQPGVERIAQRGNDFVIARF
jgi:hypothetical protein